MAEIGKYLTLDLATGRRVLKTLEASIVKFDSEGVAQHIGSVDNLQAALKTEILRAVEAEGKLTSALQEEVARAKGAEEALKALLGDIQGTTVADELEALKQAVQELEGSVAEDLREHVEDKTIHITAEERQKWNKAVEDVAAETVRAEGVEAQLRADVDAKVSKTELFEGGKIKNSLLPAIAINETFTAESREDALTKEVQNGDVVIISGEEAGTYIVVDATQSEFDDRFRELFSNADAISKGEVEKLIEALDTRLDIVEGDEHKEGSIKHALQQAKDLIAALDARVEANKQAIEEINDEDTGILAQAKEYTDTQVEAALKEAKAYTDELAQGQVKTNKESIEALQQKLDELKAEEKFVVTYEVLSGGDFQVGKAVAMNGETIKVASKEDDMVVGIVTGVVENTVSVAIMGKVSGFSGLSVGSSYYVGTNGELVSTPDFNTGSYVVLVGKAMSATSLFLRIEDGIKIA